MLELVALEEGVVFEVASEPDRVPDTELELLEVPLDDVGLVDDCDRVELDCAFSVSVAASSATVLEATNFRGIFMSDVP